MQLFFTTPVIFNIFRAHTIPITISDEVTTSIVDRGVAMMATVLLLVDKILTVDIIVYIHPPIFEQVVEFLC